MRIRAPRLHRNRRGVFCFRLKASGRDRRLSLGTKDERSASILALELNAIVERERLMKNPKLSDILPHIDVNSVRRFEIDIAKGIYKANDPADHKRMMQTLDKVRQLPPPRLVRQAAPGAATAPAQFKSPTLAEVGALWIAECRDKNADRTVYARERHLAHLVKEVSGAVKINAIVTATMVAPKTKWRTAGLNGKAIDNKLMSLHDLFKFTLDDGHYTAWTQARRRGRGAPWLCKSLERVKKRMVKNPPMTMISLRVPERVIAELKEIAAAKGFSGYQGLIRFYVSQGMRADIEELDKPKIDAIARALRKSGVSASVIEKALVSA